MCVRGKARGGGLYCEGHASNLTLVNASFDGNNATALGGDAQGDALYLQQLNYLSINDTSFRSLMRSTVGLDSVPQADCQSLNGTCIAEPGTYCTYKRHSLFWCAESPRPPSCTVARAVPSLLPYSGARLSLFSRLRLLCVLVCGEP